MISAFSFVHNALKVGIPIREAINAVRYYVDEIVVVDAESSDGTREALQELGVIIIDAEWGSDAGETLKRLHALHTECTYDTILHFEADEVYSEQLLLNIKRTGSNNLVVHRIQVEQNFQRVRWYPEPVHRVFPKGVTKKGHTTEEHATAGRLGPDNGLLWDCTNNFKDNFLARLDQQATLWGVHNYRYVPGHFNHPIITSREEIEGYLLNLPHWEYKDTFLDIPDILKPLVGKLKYED